MMRVNETLAEMNSTTVENSIGRPVAEIIPDLWPQVEPEYHHVLDRGESVTDTELSGFTTARSRRRAALADQPLPGARRR